MVILFRVLVTLHGVLNPPYTGNSQSGGYSLFLTVYPQDLQALLDFFFFYNTVTIQITLQLNYKHN